MHKPGAQTIFVVSESGFMADLEVINHLKKAIHTVQQPEPPLGHKVKKLALEIFIIVFAVSLSIWLHSWSESRHEQEEVRHFLAELRHDLKADILQYRESQNDYATKARVFSALAKPDPDPAEVSQLYAIIHDFDQPMPSLGRYESFKFSGKIGYINRPGMAGNIIRLFEEDVRRLQHRTNDYVRLQNLYHDKLNEQLIYGSEQESNIRAIAGKGIFQNLARDLRHTQAIQEGYGRCMDRIDQILTDIESELGPEKH